MPSLPGPKYSEMSYSSNAKSWAKGSLLVTNRFWPGDTVVLPGLNSNCAILRTIAPSASVSLTVDRVTTNPAIYTTARTPKTLVTVLRNRPPPVACTLLFLALATKAMIPAMREIKKPNTKSRPTMNSIGLNT